MSRRHGWSSLTSSDLTIKINKTVAFFILKCEQRTKFWQQSTLQIVNSLETRRQSLVFAKLFTFGYQVRQRWRLKNTTLHWILPLAFGFVTFGYSNYFISIFILTNSILNLSKFFSLLFTSFYSLDSTFKCRGRLRDENDSKKKWTWRERKCFQVNFWLCIF